MALHAIRDCLNPILEQDAPSVIERAKATLAASKKEFDESSRQQRVERPVKPWGYNIAPSEPLRFKNTYIRDLHLRVDLFAKVLWSDDVGGEPAVLNVAARVWCLQEEIYFRETLDAPSVKTAVDPQSGRVMLRFHFDLSNPEQSGPRHHLQIGGNPHPGEMCWFPEALGVPRFAHSPMDVVLAAELIAATFYPEEYSKIRREPTWIKAVRSSQEQYLEQYYERALTAVREGDSALAVLWNV